MTIKLKQVSPILAKRVEAAIRNHGIPTENRVLILSPKDSETITGSGIYIPGEVKEGVPRMGVIIQSGYITEDNKSYVDLVKTGNLVTYGLYAGKEKEFDNDLFSEDLREVLSKYTFTILSLTEILYVEENKI